MKLAIGTLVLATVLACGNNTANSESSATPNAATQSQTQTTGATVPKSTTKTGDYNQTNVGKGMPGAGDSRAAAPPPGDVKPAPTFATPRSPAPPNTGDPPPNDRR